MNAADRDELRGVAWMRALPRPKHAALPLDPEILEEIDTIIGMVAGDAFEGWDSYWDDQRRVSDAIKMHLTEWQQEALRKNGAPND